MSHLYTLSISPEPLAQIIGGDKRWEFRLNKNFGRLGDRWLAPGDRLLFVCNQRMDIRAAAVVGRRVCRGTDHDTGIDWPEDEDYQTAVELLDVRCPVTSLNVSTATHSRTGKTWKVRGFYGANELKRYTQDTIPLFEMLEQQWEQLYPQHP